MDWARTFRTGRLAAFVAVLALIAQTLVVAPAQAGNLIEICTPLGKQTIYVDQGVVGKTDAPYDHKASNAGHCGACVLVAPVDLGVERLAVPVRYAVRLALAPAAVMDTPPKARGPPRPFGQAPPAL